MELRNCLFKYYYQITFFKKKITKSIPIGFLNTKSIFTHIPKAAGISITEAIYGSEVGHVPLYIYKNILGDDFKKYFKFAFTRDPIRRFESAYYFLKMGGLNQLDQYFSKEVISKYTNINEFIKQYIEKKGEFCYIHFFPQYYFLEKNNSNLCDFIGKVENIADDIIKVETFLNKKINLLIKNQNTQFFKDTLTDKSIDILKNIYNRDYNLYYRNEIY